MQLPARLTEVTQAHLDRLIAVKTLEGPHLEFKGQLPQNWDNATKHEFAADTSAFANAGGGDIIFGLTQDSDGQASGFDPIPEKGIDDEVLRLQNFLRDLIEPRMQGADVRAVPVSTSSENGFAVVVRIPAGWNGPHRVKGNRAFYIRESGRKREIDVPEIRGLFLRSDSQAQRLRDFRAERIGKILSGESPHPLVSDGAYMMAHVIPVEAVVGNLDINVPQYMYPSIPRLPVFGGTQGHSVRLNIDGALQVRNPDAKTGRTYGYTQIFRSGVLEGVTTFTKSETQARPVIPALYAETYSIRFLKEAREEFARNAIQGEMLFMLALLRVKGIKLGFDRSNYSLTVFEGVFDRDILAFPEVLVEEGEEASQALRPLLDLIWQSAGLAGSENYEPATGAYKPRLSPQIY